MLIPSVKYIYIYSNFIRELTHLANLAVKPEGLPPASHRLLRFVLGVPHGFPTNHRPLVFVVVVIPPMLLTDEGFQRLLRILLGLRGLEEWGP